MFERPKSGERAIVVTVELPGSDPELDAAEFRELARSAGAEIHGEISTTRQVPDPRYFVGTGKAREIQTCVGDAGADLVLVNQPLSPAQERNLERLFSCRVLDRIGLILDIFAQRASTFEGKLQVELAQLQHLRTRVVRGWTHLERQKGGIGLRGPGEKQLEMDRRLIGERIRSIRQRLAGVQQRRSLSRRSRRKSQLPSVALVGYTNAGKSSVFNILTGAGVLVADRLFATLDPTLRRLTLSPAMTVILADTVGFVGQLPHELVVAFRATLEETRSADLLLHVIDATVPDRELRRRQVNDVLAEIGAADIPQIEVYNKSDLLTDAPVPTTGTAASPSAGDFAWAGNGRIARVWLSAHTGAGLETFHAVLRAHFEADLVRHTVHLPVAAGRLRARLFELGAVVNEESVADGGSILDVCLAPKHFGLLCRREGLSACLRN